MVFYSRLNNTFLHKFSKRQVGAKQEGKPCAFAVQGSETLIFLKMKCGRKIKVAS